MNWKQDWNELYLGMPPTPFWMSSLNTTNIGRIARRLVVLWGVLASIKRGHPERGRGIPNYTYFSNSL